MKVYKFVFALCLLSIPLISTAEVSKIIFSTEEHTVKPNEISPAITIQLQDSSGNQYQTPETIDLEFVSTSATGEFVSSSGSTASKTMNKNTANRTFYYRDSSEGVFNITVNATSRDSGKTYTISQKITISSSGFTNTNGNGEVLSASTEDDALSSTSGASLPTYGTVSSKLEISGGGNRLTTPGSPITFQAQIRKNSSSNDSVKFSWSFGDGNVGVGALVTHIYKYPGEYVVVLNASSGNTFATNRIKVVVVEANILVSDKGGYIEIYNDSLYEVNLYNWKIVNDRIGFIFQPDTIILPKSKLMLDKALFSMKGQPENGVVLKNFLGEVVTKSESAIKREKVEEIENSLNNARTQVAEIIDIAIEKNLVQEKSPLQVKAGQDAIQIKKETVQEKNIKEDNLNTTNSNVIYESSSSDSMFSKLTNFVKRVLFK